MTKMSSVAATARVEELFSRRTAPLVDLAGHAEDVARTCQAMAGRFHRAGKLVVFGNGGPSTAAQHVAVEFVHPVIVGKRALPAVSLTADIATVTGVVNRVDLSEVFAHQIRLLAEPRTSRSACPPTATARTSCMDWNRHAGSACSPSPCSAATAAPSPLPVWPGVLR